MAGQQFSAEADHKTKHGKTAIPGFGKFNEAKAGGGLSHGIEWVDFINLNTTIAICDEFPRLCFCFP
ncbi:hypothetical protein KQ301_10350 [Synechococcus sp. CS-601]|nr:hypothetical protein BM449_08170 [Synechococcus sp. SynAce01]MCT0246691.1 hypothetical protein [Synechococcus sp. CS-601]